MNKDRRKLSHSNNIKSCFLDMNLHGYVMKPNSLILSERERERGRQRVRKRNQDSHKKTTTCGGWKSSPPPFFPSPSSFLRSKWIPLFHSSFCLSHTEEKEAIIMRLFKRFTCHWWWSWYYSFLPLYFMSISSIATFFNLFCPSNRPNFSCDYYYYYICLFSPLTFILDHHSSYHDTKNWRETSGCIYLTLPSLSSLRHPLSPSRHLIFSFVSLHV